MGPCEFANGSRGILLDFARQDQQAPIVALGPGKHSCSTIFVQGAHSRAHGSAMEGEARLPLHRMTGPP